EPPMAEPLLLPVETALRIIGRQLLERVECRLKRLLRVILAVESQPVFTQLPQCVPYPLARGWRWRWVCGGLFQETVGLAEVLQRFGHPAGFLGDVCETEAGVGEVVPVLGIPGEVGHQSLLQRLCRTDGLFSFGKSFRSLQNKGQIVVTVRLREPE